jgi:hypothetical protein
MAIFPSRRDLLAAASIGLIGAVGRASAQAVRRIDFEGDAIGALPSGVTSALTGGGAPPVWKIVEDATAPAGPKVLAQTSADRTDNRFPLAIFERTTALNVDVRLRFKAVAGRDDRAGGIAVRLRDPNNYYVVRANALEDNVRLYRVVGGKRTQFAGASAKVASNTWLDLRLRVEGDRFEVFFEGRSLYRASDRTFGDSGRVALWTKSDSVTYFDDIQVAVLP